MLFMLFSLNQPHQLRNPQRQRRYVGHCEEQDEEHCEVGKQGLGHCLDADFADAAAHEQNGANRRGHVAHAHIEDEHNAELNAGHSQAFRDGQEDGSENQDGRRDVHEHAYNQQDDVHQEENHDGVGGHTHDS